VTPGSFDPALLWALRLALAGIWALAARHKLADLQAFRGAVVGYRLLPEASAGVFATGVCVAEIALVLGLLTPASAGPAALVSALLLALYAGAMAVNLARGRRDLDCGCAGPGFRRPIGEGLLIRNGALIAVSLLAALPPTGRSLNGLDVFTVAVGAATLLLLHSGVEVALANAPGSRALGRRSLGDAPIARAHGRTS
jgi:uncharacterized membrane protein YphA (DoxX/SURF4 family)